MIVKYHHIEFETLIILRVLLRYSSSVQWDFINNSVKPKNTKESLCRAQLYKMSASHSCIKLNETASGQAMKLVGCFWRGVSEVLKERRRFNWEVVSASTSSQCAEGVLRKRHVLKQSKNCLTQPEADLWFINLWIQRMEGIRYLLVPCPKDPHNAENQWSSIKVAMLLLCIIMSFSASPVKTQLPHLDSRFLWWSRWGSKRF